MVTKKKVKNRSPFSGYNTINPGKKPFYHPSRRELCKRKRVVYRDGKKINPDFVNDNHTEECPKCNVLMDHLRHLAYLCPACGSSFFEDSSEDLVEYKKENFEE